jgi:hypothetical protein
MDAKLQAAPPLQLLLEFEPAHRVFFRNLADALLGRQAPRVAVSSRPGTFWNDVFVYSAMPWRSFSESILWHVFVLAVAWTLFLKAGAPHETPRQRMFRDSRIIYYPPQKSFPATESRRARAREQPKVRRELAQQQKIRVTAEPSAHTLMLPPDLMLAHSAQPDSVVRKIAAATPLLPAMPLAATGRARRAMTAGPGSAVAPSPDVNQASARRLGLAQASAVAPAPQVGAGSPRQAVAAPSSAVVAPPPTMPGSMRSAGDINIGHSAAVAPAPQLPMREQGAVSGAAKKGLGGVAALAVPPPPTVGGPGTIANGRANPVSGTGARVVPPAPSVGEGGNSGLNRRPGSGRGTSLSGAASSVVAPAPSVEGGDTAGGRRASSLSGAASSAVPPAPSIATGDGGGSGGSRRSNSLSGAGTQVVPPAPSVDAGSGSSGNGRGNSLAGTGVQVVGPPASMGNGNGEDPGGNGRANSWGYGDAQVVPPGPSLEGTGNSGGSGQAMGNPEAAAPAQAAADDHREQAVQELPVNLIGLVLALPGTSYFSNYEVFLARRRMSKDQTVLIKLVYEFLPYQRRLSEYDLKNAKVYRLSVVRDTSCDETLAQLLHPQIDESHPGKAYSIDPQVLGPNDPNSVMACYRTTADEFQKSVTRIR